MRNGPADNISVIRYPVDLVGLRQEIRERDKHGLFMPTRIHDGPANELLLDTAEAAAAMARAGIIEPEKARQYGGIIQRAESAATRPATTNILRNCAAELLGTSAHRACAAPKTLPKITRRGADLMRELEELLSGETATDAAMVRAYLHVDGENRALWKIAEMAGTSEQTAEARIRAVKQRARYIIKNEGDWELRRAAHNLDAWTRRAALRVPRTRSTRRARWAATPPRRCNVWACWKPRIPRC